MVFGRGLITCPLYVAPLFGYLVLNNRWSLKFDRMGVFSCFFACVFACARRAPCRHRESCYQGIPLEIYRAIIHHKRKVSHAIHMTYFWSHWKHLLWIGPTLTWYKIHTLSRRRSFWAQWERGLYDVHLLMILSKYSYCGLNHRLESSHFSRND